MRNTKKDAMATVRLDSETKAALEEIAAAKEWTLSYVINKACLEYVEAHNAAAIVGRRKGTK